MDVISRKQIVLSDNEDRPPNLHPLPVKTFTATMSYEGHQEMKRIILGDQE